MFGNAQLLYCYFTETLEVIFYAAAEYTAPIPLFLIGKPM